MSTLGGIYDITFYAGEGKPDIAAAELRAGYLPQFFTVQAFIFTFQIEVHGPDHDNMSAAHQNEI